MLGDKERFAELERKLAELGSRMERRVCEQTEKLAAAQARIKLLEHDAKSDGYETLYAQTVTELAAAQATIARKDATIEVLREVLGRFEYYSDGYTLRLNPYEKEVDEALALSNDRTALDADDILIRLLMAQCGACTCLTKTPDTRYHAANCT